MPANVDRRSNTRCSGSVSSSYDHCTRSRSVRWRGSVARREPASTRNRSGSRSASCAGLIDRMRAAASSSASGTPSRRMQISATAVGGRRRRARSRVAPARARSTNSCTAGDLGQRSRAARRGSPGTGSGGTDHTTSAGDAERFPAGREHVHVRAPAQHELDELARGVEDVLAVVEHEQQRPATRGARRSSRASDRLGRCCTSSASATAAATAAWVAHGRELDEADTVGEAAAMVVGEAVREPGLADTAGTEQREDAARLEQPGRELEVAFAPDERRGLGRHAAPRVAPGRRSRVARPVTAGATQARSARSSRIAVSRSRIAADGSSPSSSRSRPRNSCATRSASRLPAGAVEREHQLRRRSARAADGRRSSASSSPDDLLVPADRGARRRSAPRATTRSSSRRIASGRIHSASANSANAAPRHSPSGGVERVERGVRDRSRAAVRLRRACASNRPASTSGRRAPRARSPARGCTR